MCALLKERDKRAIRKKRTVKEPYNFDKNRGKIAEYKNVTSKERKRNNDLGETVRREIMI